MHLFLWLCLHENFSVQLFDEALQHSMLSMDMYARQSSGVTTRVALRNVSDCASMGSCLVTSKQGASSKSPHEVCEDQIFRSIAAKSTGSFQQNKMSIQTRILSNSVADGMSLLSQKTFRRNISISLSRHVDMIENVEKTKKPGSPSFFLALGSWPSTTMTAFMHLVTSVLLL